MTMGKRTRVKANGQATAETLFDKFGNSKALRTTLDAGGRVVIPAEFRKALGVAPGDHVLIRFLDGEVRIYTLDHAIERIQAWVRSFVPEGIMLSEELIAERRAEAARE
jgi:AbrB family looped-hinge helix DNA binding protein